VFGVEAKDEDKKEATASASASTSMLNLAGMVPLAKDKRHHTGVGVLCVTRHVQTKQIMRGFEPPLILQKLMGDLSLSKCTKLHKFQHFSERYF